MQYDCVLADDKLVDYLLVSQLGIYFYFSTRLDSSRLKGIQVNDELLIADSATPSQLSHEKCHLFIIF